MVCVVRKSLPAHLSPIPGVFPTLEYIQKYIVKDPEHGDHWFWHDSRRNHRHNLTGHALVTWRVKRTARNHTKLRGEYVVARLLLEQRFGPLAPRLRIQNLCGLPQCVNPSHWQVPHQPVVQVPWRLAVYPAAPWRLIDKLSGVEVEAVTPVRLYAYSTVHIARIEPSFRRTVGVPLTTLCGVVVDPSVAMLVDAAVTCVGGC